MSLHIRKQAGTGKKQLTALLANAKNSDVQVGWVERKQYPASSITTASAAAINEFGAIGHNIPPRPFMRPTISKQQNEWKKIASNEFKRIMKQEQSINGTMEIIGLKVAGDIRETITQIQSPALSPKTIAARIARRANKHMVGNLTKPLVDTGYMLNSLTHKVVNNSK
jgi:hypothetical protein